MNKNVVFLAGRQLGKSTINRLLFEEYLKTMIGNCAKRVVICTIVTPGGEHIVGKNWCSNPQNVCPRNEYEDYEKCKTVCQQWGHAEAVAAVIAGPKALGARAYVEGHSYACRACQEALFSAGVKSVSVGKPEAQPRGTF